MMKVNAIGVIRMSGEKSRKSEKPYDFARLYTLVPMTSGTRGSATVVASGSQETQLDMDLAAYPEFAALPYPCTVEVEYRLEQMPNGVKMTVTGLVKSKTK